MSAKDEQIVKVEGWVRRTDDQFYGSPGIRLRTIEVRDAKGNYNDRPCTLLIAPEGSTQVPRVFSEGEVRAKDERIALLEGMLYEAAGYADEVTDSEGAEEFAQRCRALLNQQPPTT